MEEIKIIENFLPEKNCKNLIKRFKEYNGKFEKFNKRFLLKLLNYPEDNLFKETIDLYYLPNQKIENIEILFWELGESHAWHKDSVFYKYTTITYLNEGYVGGKTIIENNIIEPKTGKYVGFDADKMHCVTELKSGQRFVLICWYNPLVV